MACNRRPQNGHAYVAGFPLCAGRNAHQRTSSMVISLACEGVEFDHFSLVLLVTGPKDEEIDERKRGEIQDAHLNHLATLHEAGKLIAAGPLVGGGDTGFRGASILTVGADEARALCEQDPAVQAGVFDVRILPWLVPAGAVGYSRTTFPHSSSEATG
jgi:uncharacterized protein YciI